jgi:hypothetical protein
MVQPSFFDYRTGKANMRALCIVNGFHESLYKWGQRGHSPSLITFNKPQKVMGQLDVSEIPLDGVPTDTWIVRVQKLFLRERGIHIAAVHMRELRESLVVSYLLRSCVCFVKYKTQRGTGYTLVTKNPLLVSSLALAPADIKKGLKGFDTQFGMSYEELRTGSFQAVALSRDVDGVRLGKLKVSARSARHLVPYYSVDNYASRLVDILSRFRVVLTFRDPAGVQKRLLTTLINKVTADWSGSSVESAAYLKWADWNDPTSLGYLSLPNLSKRGEFVSVPILSIEDMKPAISR